MPTSASRATASTRIGDLAGESAKTTVDAAGKAVAPGFINMLSWATESLLVDGRSQGDIRQGVTLEIFGEGSSMGPLNDTMKKRMVEEMGDIKYDITWTTLAEYLKELERRGVSTNVASFIGATTIREHVIGLEDKKPTPAQLDEMRALVKQEMEAGALGIGSSLIYAPAFYASTEELIELCKVAAQYQGKVHLPHPERGQSPARGRRRADSHQPRGAGSRPRSTTSRRPARRTGRRSTP